MKAEFRRMMQFYFDDFKEMIGRGRGMKADQVAAVATAKIWAAPEALDLKLIDAIQTTDETLAKIQATVAQSGRAQAARSGAVRRQAMTRLTR
jgi:ClpP class serine protease